MSDTLAVKDPDEVLDYGRNWEPELTADDETVIASSTWSEPSPTGLTVLDSPPGSINGMITTIWVGGGDPGKKYSLTNTITTPGGRTYERTIIIPCRER